MFGWESMTLEPPQWFRYRYWSNEVRQILDQRGRSKLNANGRIADDGDSQHDLIGTFRYGAAEPGRLLKI